MIVLFQMTHHFFINGVDSYFHMAITYDTARQFKTGHFSYFLTAFGFFHSLRIVNAVYGPLGGYFSGLLLLMTGTWARWQITTFLIVFIVAGVSMYQLCRYWHVTRVYSILLGCLYMFSFPIMSMWLNSQYDGFGAIFIPWVLEFGSKILNQDRFKNWPLVLLLVILAELHVFTMLLALFVLGMCFVVALIINSERGRLITKAIKVLLLSLILSFNVWGGILEVIDSNRGRIIPTYSNNDMFQNVWGSVFYNPQAPFRQNLFLLGLSTTVLIFIITVLYIFSIKHLSLQLNFIMVILGLGFLWLSSRLFPWPLLQRHFPILDTDLQFPKRFLPVALSALMLMLGVLLTKLQHRISNRHVIAIVFAVGLGLFVFHAWQNNQYQARFLYHEQFTSQYYGRAFHAATGDGWINNKAKPSLLRSSLSNNHPGRYFNVVSKPTPDYLPSNQKIRTDAQYHHLNGYYQYDQQVIQNPLRYHFRISHHTIMVSFSQRSSKAITLPFVKYAHTYVTLNGKALDHPKISPVGVIILKPRMGHNVMAFKYVPAMKYRIIMWLSIIVWLMFVINIFFEVEPKFKK